MKIIYNKIFLEHDTGMHPENKKRLISLGELPDSEIPYDEEVLTLFHTQDYIDLAREASKKHLRLDEDTILSEKSFEVAVKAVNATILASEQNDFAIVRPPGHHAHDDNSSGFCIFNNIGIAAQKLADEGKKVLIFDFDGHLGDGTVKHFYNSNKVFYFSLHQFPAFPGGSEDEIGEGEGRGYTINVPLPPGCADDVFLDAVNRFMPILKEFNPDVVAVSAGFDAHEEDLLLDLRLSVNAYYEIGKILKANFNNIFATLEGGYNTSVLSKCVYNFLDGINQKPIRFKEHSTDTMFQIREEYDNRMYTLEKNLSSIWKN